MLVERWLTSSFEDRESALISRRYGVHGFFILLLYWKWCSYILQMGVWETHWIVVKDVKPLVVYDVECGMAMEPIKGKWAYSWVDFRYTNLFCILEVTTVFFSSCVSVLGDSLEFHQGHQGSLRVWLGIWNSSAHNAGESGLILRQGQSLMRFLMLRKAPGVYSLVTAQMTIWNSGLFSKDKTPV